jgi:ABC-type multidrug transport system fused ATPase/permease subunit
LIAGYLFPEKGSILIDGQALPHGRTVRTSKTVSLESYYQHIGYLTQEPMVFDGTIRDNILYALPENDVDISHERIHEVLKLACCDFVFDLPKGIDTQIGEKGVRLSGGQRQRLAIAKIMLKDPQIVLLDEPTSALDSLNEQLITTALHNLFVGRTVIVIAHRLQTVKECDEILVIDEGKILQRGRHDELVKQG